jgi:hypothetical protein
VSRIPTAVVNEVLERAQGHCEACSWPILGAYALHHRHPRGRGGSKLPWIDTAVNLMVLHGDFDNNCHNLTSYSVHSRVTRSRRLGHIIPYGTDPATVPVTVEPRLRAVLL